VKLEAQVFLSKEEMEALANAVSGFYNLCFKEKITPSKEQTALLLSVMDKVKRASIAIDSGIIT